MQPLWKIVWRLLRKLKIGLLYDLAIPLLGIYPDKTTVQKATCTPMSIAAPFTTAMAWKQPKRPWIDEWIQKLLYMYAGDYYSVMKKNEIMLFVATWMTMLRWLLNIINTNII